MTEHAPPHSFNLLPTTISHFIFPVSLESKYQVAEKSLVKLNMRRKINQPVEKVFIMQQSRGLMELFIEANNIIRKPKSLLKVSSILSNKVM
jgi:hypothetical protein